jgi:hypothetical protein
LKWKGKSRLDWNWKGFDLVGTATYLDGFHEFRFVNSHGSFFPPPGIEHYVKQTWFFDVQGSYGFKFSEPTQSWRALVNNTTLTIGCNDVFGHDPPRAFNVSVGYPGSLYDSVGRFVYVSVRKRF